MLKYNILKESEAVDDYLDYLDRQEELRLERMSPEAYERYQKEERRKSELAQKKWREVTVPRMREACKQKGFDRSVFPKNIEALDYDERFVFFDKYMQGFRGYTLVRLNGKWNLVDYNDNVLFDTWFDKLSVPERRANSQNKNFIRVKLNNKYNYLKIVTKGKKIIYLSDIWFDYADNFRDDWGHVKINRNDNEYLWINTNGELFYDDGTPYEQSSQENHNELQNNVTNEAKSMSKKNTIRLTESELKNIIVESVKKIIKEDCDNIESQFSDWALNGSKTSHRGFNAMGKLYEYYYEDDDNALFDVADEFSNEFGCDIDEVYEVARKFANQYFYYNPVDMEDEDIMESCNKLNEESLRGTHSDICYQLAEDLLKVMEPISLIAKLGERMGFFAMRKYLEGIARIEMPDNYGEDIE